MVLLAELISAILTKISDQACHGQVEFQVLKRSLTPDFLGSIYQPASRFAS